MRLIEKTVSLELAGRTVRSLLAAELRCSSSLIKRLKRRPGSVTLNDEPVLHVNVCVAAGDILRVDVDDEGVGEERFPCGVPIVYEDDDILIIDKPSGMAVHPAGMTAFAGTVAEAVGPYLGGRALHCVNRLDRGTSGLMAIAKSGYAHELMRRSLHTDTMLREYRAVALGVVSPPEGLVDLPIARERESSVRRCIDEEGFPSRTRYETLTAGGGYTLLRIIPETGRTHQIRVHMAAIGHPLAGDWLYGIEDPDLITRPALHSFRLSMRSPVTGTPVCITAPLPDDMLYLLKKIR